MRKWIFLTLFFASSTMIQSQANSLVNAEVAFDKENYVSCISMYKELEANGYSGTEFYFNLASAYYKNDQLAESVLYYLKVLKLDERNNDALNNLKIVNNQRASDITGIPNFFLRSWWLSFSGVFSSTLWAVLFLFVLILSVYYFYLGLFNRLRRKKYLSIMGVYVLLSVLFLVSAYSKNHRENDLIYLVNLKNVVLYKGPDLRSGKVIDIIAGEKLEYIDQRVGWYKVSLINKDIGWIPIELVEGV